MFGIYMVKRLFGGLTLLDEFNKRGGKDRSLRGKLFGEKSFENFVGGDDDDKWAEPLNFSFGNGVDAEYARDLLAGCNERTLCNNGDKLCKLKRSVNYAGDTNNKPSAAYKNNQNKINRQVGVDASQRLQRLKAKQNLIVNDCPKYDRGINTKGTVKTIFDSNGKVSYIFKCNGSCNTSISQHDYKLHTPKHGLYERYYLKRGRSMLTEDELLRCKMKRTKEELENCELLTTDVERAACRSKDCRCPAVSTRIKL
jgi:hypothetical protein